MTSPPPRLPGQQSAGIGRLWSHEFYDPTVDRTISTTVEVDDWASVDDPDRRAMLTLDDGRPEVAVTILTPAAARTLGAALTAWAS